MDSEKNGSSLTASYQQEAAPTQALDKPKHWHDAFFTRVRDRRMRSRLVDPVISSYTSHSTSPLRQQQDTPEAPRLPKRGEKVKCELKDIMNKLRPFQLQVNGARPPLELDSLARYGVDEADAYGLRKIDAERALAVIEDPGKPIIAAKYLVGRQYSQDACKGEACYQWLSSMSKTISAALNLCLLDNECVNVQYYRPGSSRERLQEYIQRARVAEQEESARNEDVEYRESVYNLIDYMAAVLARLISQTAAGEFWLLNTLAALVARIAKIKYLLVNIVANACMAANAGQEILDNDAEKGLFGNFSMNTDFEEEECEEALRVIEANQKDGLASQEEASISAYCVNQNRYRSGLNNVLRHALGSLRLMNRSGLPATTYEMCLLVYDIGFEGFKTVLFQDRDLEYGASSDRDVLNTTQSAVIILDQILGKLQESKKPQGSNTVPPKPRPTSTANRNETFVEWAYREPKQPGEGAEESIELVPQRIALDSMADIVAVMVPLAFTSPLLQAGFTKFRTMMALTGDVKDVVHSFEEGHFGTYCRLYTEEFDLEARTREILRLSQAFELGTFSRYKLIDKMDHKPSKSSHMAKEHQGTAGHMTLHKELTKCSGKMDGWLVDESSVTVECRRYVSGVMITALILAAGGLAIGFTVGERIEGVDPFNLATYAWVVAAFVILIGKAVLVENWAWSDFLQFRVRCKSVSELAATTQIDEQVILAKLLHDDCGDGILVARGPFNSVFQRQANSEDGFSIDVKIKPLTLILSGITPLKVVTPRGNAILCLDHRRGTFLAFVEHDGVKEKEHLVCDEIDRHMRDWKTSKPRRGQHPCKLHLTKTKEFKWKRVQGLCNLKEGDVVFV
ncbi:hypothetical protein S40288_09970 [Stachybotrys chartarum IBT 40288]|nr:hypothetical protein S40288_09970 [Stachybotrys chartarum IBT 40288]